MTVVSRLELNHPALGATGGAGLHASIESLYQKIGDNMQSRWFSLVDFDQAETADLQHNFEMDISLLRYDFWNYAAGEWTKITDTSTPSLSAFTIIEKVGFEDTVLQITNNTGGNNLTFAVSIINDPIYLKEGDVEDVDITTVAPEDGQALVYDVATGKFKPGASGDSSFKLQSIAANVATVKSGSIFLDDGKELYLAADAVFNLKTAVNTLGVTLPAATTAYYVYLDLSGLPAQTSVGTSDRKVYAVTSGIAGLFVVLATTPEATDLSRYVPLYSLKTDGSSNYTAFSNLAFRRHQVPAVNISPMVYEDADHSIGTVGSAGQLATYGSLAPSDFPTPANAHVYGLDTNSNDSNSTPLNLTQNGTNSFTQIGMFGKENINLFDGSTTYLSSTNAFFNITTGSFTTGAWVRCSDWFSGNQAISCKWNDGATNHRQYLFLVTSTGITVLLSTNGTAATTTLAYTTSSTVFEKNSMHHLVCVFDNPNNLVKIYINGQLAASTTAAGDLFNGTSAQFQLGALQSAGVPTGFLKGTLQDAFFDNGVLTDSQINLIYSKRFKGQQLAGGHALDVDSFPLSSLAGKATFYNLSANANDGSVNAKNLTNNGSTPFTGLGLFGAANAAQLNGTSQYFNITDSFFAEATSRVPMGFFAWVALDDYTPGTTNRLFTWTTGPTIYFDGTSLILDASIALSVPISSLGLVDGHWAHIGVTFIKGTNTLWVNGVAVASNTVDYGTTSSSLFIGSTQTPSQYLKGRISNVCFLKNFDITALDVQKLMSARVDLASSVAVRAQDQNWKANFISEDGKTVSEMLDGFLLDKDDTKAWFYFGGGSASRVNLRLYDGGLGATTVPVRKFDRTFTVAPATTLAHNLPSMPTSIVILHNQNADGKYVEIGGDAGVKADGTNIYVDLSAYTIDATHDVRIVASIGMAAIGSTDTSLVSAFKDSKVLSQVNLGLLTAVNGTPGVGQFRSDIVGRASMIDIGNDLLPRMGVERIMVQAIMLTEGEIGANGGLVYKPVNDKYNQIRYVSRGLTTNVHGSYTNIDVVNQYVEIVFNGTGLNALLFPAGSNIQVSIDGGAEVDKSPPSTIVGTLSGRGYAPNTVINLASGLTAGLHTAKIRNNSGTGFYPHGFEILNESVSIRTAPGTAIVNGLKRTLLAADTQAYNTTFDSGTLGTRGGRVLQYIRADGTIGKSVQPVAAASATLSSTDHTAANEEVIRSYFWREFGAGRSDDFSTMITTGATRSFTLDDGTTTLSCTSLNGVSTGFVNGIEGVVTNNAGRPITLEFVGSGLDVQLDGQGAGNLIMNITIDGVALASTPAFTPPAVLKIVSGLTYGSHTVKIDLSGASPASAVIQKFFVYGPKKPTLPAGATELADYNIVADSVAASSSALNFVSSGVIRKASLRGWLYSGTWQINLGAPTVPDPASFDTGWEVDSSTPTSFATKTFFGTGFEFRGYIGTAHIVNATFTVDGFALNAGTNVGSTVSFVSTGITGLTLSAAGVLTGTSSGAGMATIRVTGLAAGNHTFKYLQNGSTPSPRVCALDEITPIHVHKSNGPFVVQNTLSVGSEGVSDKRFFGNQLVTYLPKSIASAVTVGTSTTATGVTPFLEMLASIKTSGGSLEITLYATTKNTSSSVDTGFLVRVDGTLYPGSVYQFWQSITANLFATITMTVVVPVLPGNHVVQGFWVVGGGVGNSDGLSRHMTVKELP